MEVATAGDASGSGVASAAAAGGSSDGEKKKPPEGEPKSKRKMKTASQLEILEKTYAAEQYPNETMRAELSVKLGLSDRQLQMWFCHRRLKDRKAPSSAGKRQRKEAPPMAAPEEMVEVEVGNEHVSGSGSGTSPVRHGVESRRIMARPGVAIARIGGDVVPMKRYYEPPQSILELRAIAFVEAQLGESLREDGPILGMEFDPLPPDAFGAPIATSVQPKHSGRPFEPQLYERPDPKPIKGSGRALHEYQFLPEQPTVRTDTYERVGTSYHYGSPADGPNARTSLSAGRSYAHGTDQVPSGYGLPGQVPSLNLSSHQGRQSQILPSTSAEYDNVPRKNSYMNMGVDSHFAPHPITTLENPFISSDKRGTHDDEVSRMERKRKGEEARIAREVEAHEKRIRKELEKQDILRRKREEQIKKEMERHDRERRKEEERLLREKQREEERYLREQRREIERRERFLQKESIRVEKMRQKEEQRREKEVARLKAANERAIARKIAKESMELVEDERLELMELAMSTKGLPSIVSLDFETLQNLELFRDMLTVFPPKSVRLKKPFSVKPWSESEDNIGNLLMVWRFLITFADILGLWPFTLDEFIQAFHDYDPRLLGEIHVALLRSIIKDIEDVARTPSTGMGTNQNVAANPGGGHPHIVEGAYAWGFDIRNWQHHLNPLTWPEILRQLALSAGFGPQLKSRNIEHGYLRDDNEGNDGKDVISNLRNGAAAENAVAIMQERGFSNPRRSRHRLTPGTVKFAAFHVLSIEGSEGLTILDVADKIQKSGLRDLTTSKTPEASIAAALSRDTKLFERTAPSTYCVRSAYRKDPADADSILSAARERIRIFKSGGLDGEEADDAERDGDVERDEDSDCDVAEDPEIDELGIVPNTKEEVCIPQEGKIFGEDSPMVNGIESDNVLETSQSIMGNMSGGLSAMHSKSFNEAEDSKPDAAGVCNDTIDSDQDDTDIDASDPGESWVQGLSEGEYSDLSVEERLNALVALIGIGIEGNSIRVALEERLEAANALKKQMWAEAQLDKRRIKEDYVTRMQYSSFMGTRTDLNPMFSSTEIRQSPLPNVEKNETSVVEQGPNDPQANPNYLNNFPSEGNQQMQDLCAGVDNISYQQFAAEKSRSQLKSYIGYKAEEMYVYRSLPLGLDRRRNRYWQFITSASHNDPGRGRIFVELRDGRWRLIDSEEGFDALLASLDVRGVRESHLHSMLLKIEMSFKETIRRNVLHSDNGWGGDAIKTEPLGTESPTSTVAAADIDVAETSTSFTIELGRNETEKNDALRRYQDFEKWMWTECFSSSTLCARKYGNRRCLPLLGSCDHCHEVYLLEGNHCPSCHKTYGTSMDVNFSDHVSQCEEKLKMDPGYTLRLSVSSPLRIRLLKLQLAAIEAYVLPESLEPCWTDGYRSSWAMQLHSSSSSNDLLQILTLLESALRRDYISSDYETSCELLGSSKLSEFAANNSMCPKPIHLLPWVPQTTSAVALRLMEFDASIFYALQQKMDSQKQKDAGDLIKVPSRFAMVKNNHDAGVAGTSFQADHHQEENLIDVGIAIGSYNRSKGGRGRGRVRTRGGRSQKGARSDHGKRSKSERLGDGLAWKGKSRGRGRGRRSARSRQKPEERVIGIVDEKEAMKESNFDDSPATLMREDWNGDDMTGLPVEEGAENASSSSERSEYGDEFDDMAVDGYSTGYNGKSVDFLDGSDYNVDDEEEDEEDDGAEYEQGGGVLDVEGYINGDSEEEEDKAVDRDLNQDEAMSTDYSD